MKNVTTFDARCCKRKSRMPAKLDRWQSLTGLFLALFMACHMIFTSTILLGPEAFDWVIGKAEMDFWFEGGLPWITSLVTLGVLVLFLAHGFLAMRKLPANYLQLTQFLSHRQLLSHTGTTLWWLQCLSGLALLVLGGAHLLMILTSKETLSATTAAYRFVHGGLGSFYLLLLLMSTLHAGIGAYRLILKWCPIEASEPKTLQRRIRNVRSEVFGVFGVLTLLALWADFTYIKHGKNLSPLSIQERLTLAKTK